MAGPEPVVEAEYGPSLPALLGPRVRRLPRALRAALAAVGLAAVVAVAVLVVGERGVTDHVRSEAPAFNLRAPDPLREVAPGPGERLRLEERRGDLFLSSFVVRPLSLAPYRGAVEGELPLVAGQMIRREAAARPDFVLVEEGRANVNEVSGYGYVFRARLGGRALYGRVVLLPEPEPGTRRGVILEMLGTPAAGLSGAQDAGAVGELKSTYRSFRFGTERP